MFTSPGDIAEVFKNHFTIIGQSVAQEIPSLEIDPLAFINPVNGAFLFNGSILKKSPNYLRLSM